MLSKHSIHELYVFHAHRLLSSAHFDFLPFPSQMFFQQQLQRLTNGRKKDSTNLQLMKHFHSQTNVVFLLCDISIDKNKQVPLSTIYLFHHNFELHSKLPSAVLGKSNEVKFAEARSQEGWQVRGVRGVEQPMHTKS